MGKDDLPWHVVERAINKEIKWLKRVIDQTSPRQMPGCDECLSTYRKIGLLIITGEVGAKEIRAKTGHDLWGDLTKEKGFGKNSRHGGVWHRKMLDVLRHYFSKRGFEVIDEPFLAKGRADLGVYKKGYKDLFIEVGTTSLYKLWWNLRILNNVVILLVPSETSAIEFVCFDKPISERTR